MLTVADFPRGTRIKIKKGTPIRTTGTARHKVAGKDYEVSVHHTLSGIRITPSTALHDRNYRYRLADFGTSELELQKLRENDPAAYFRELSIVVSKPSVVWAGTGGYWHECDMDLVEIVAMAPALKAAA